MKRVLIVLLLFCTVIMLTGTRSGVAYDEYGDGCGDCHGYGGGTAIHPEHSALPDCTLCHVAGVGVLPIPTSTCAWCHPTEASGQCQLVKVHDQDYGASCRGCHVAECPSMQVFKVKLKAGKKDSTDSLKLSGWLDANEDDLEAAVGGNILFIIGADYIPVPGTIEYMFPVTQDTVKSGKYKSPKDPIQSFSLDINSGEISFAVKKDDLTGVSCPVTFMAQFGDYEAEAEVDADIINDNKPCPVPLLMGAANYLDAAKVKAKKGKTTGSDSISIFGSFAVNGFAGSFDTGQPVVIVLGTDTFTVPGAQFTEKKGTYSCKSADSGNGLVSAKFDTVKARHSIKIKNATVTESGDVVFAVNLFSNPLEASETITLPPEF